MRSAFRPQVQVGKPEADELGYADVVEAQEIGGQRVSLCPTFGISPCKKRGSELARQCVLALPRPVFCTPHGWSRLLIIHGKDVQTIDAAIRNRFWKHGSGLEPGSRFKVHSGLSACLL